MTPPPSAPGSFAPPTRPVAGGSADDAATLVDLLTQQRDHYRQLRDLSDRQRDLIAAGQPEHLLAVLGQRQAHVEALTQLNDRLAPMRPRMSEVSESSPAPVKAKLRELVDEVQSLLEQIIQQDEADRAKLAAGRDAVKQQLGQMSRTPAALNAYKTARPHAAASRFTDRQG